MSTHEKLIFVVDDDTMMCQMLADHLSKNPINQVQTFGTGEECLAELRNNPTAIILDIKLNTENPDAADGMEILEQIKRIDEHIPVIMLSGQDHYGIAAQSILKGATDYVMKDKEAFTKLDGILESIH